MSKNHGQKGHRLKPEAKKCPVSQRHKKDRCPSPFRRFDGGHFQASDFNPWRLCVFVFLVAFAFFVPVHAASASQPVTVRDYFLRLPDRYFEVPPDKREEAFFGGAGNNLTDTLDIKNDYFHASGDGAQPPLTVALFRYRGVVTVAVLDGGYDPEIPTLDFLCYQKGHWLNVTRNVLPLPFDNRLAYFLPRRGTTIRVCNSHGHTVYNLLWRQGRFRLGVPR